MDETIHPSAPEDQHVPLRWRNPLPSVALVAESITVASLIERKQLFKVDPQQPARDAADRLGRFDFDAAPQLDSYRPGCPPKGRLNNKYLALSVTLSTCGWEGAAR
jgi:hypothetical protein